MEFPDFDTMDFPRNPNIAYILGITFNGEFAPFYVGQTTRHIGRIGDYVSGKFSASTDFRVGEAAKCFLQKSFPVQVKFKECENPAEEEGKLLLNLEGKGRRLLNREGYDPKTANEEQERQKIHRFVEEFLQNRGTVLNP